MTIHPNAELVRRYWSTAESRDWEGFAALLHPDVVYEAHQTRERVTGREPYVRFNAEFPGDWHEVADWHWSLLQVLQADDEDAAANLFARHAAGTLLEPDESAQPR